MAKAVIPMYDELIEQMRSRASWLEFATIAKPSKTDGNGYAILFRKAADAIEDLITVLTASNEVIAKNKPRWIPVTERLPEEYEYVLCRTDYGMEVGYHRDEWGQDEWTTGELGSGTIDVSHWMPLPQPPESEDEP